MLEWMRSLLPSVLLVLLGWLCTAAPARGGVVSDELESLVGSSASGTRIAVIIRLRDPLDVRKLALDSQRQGETPRVRRERVVRALKGQLGQSHRELRQLLARRGARLARDLWIINGVAAQVPAGFIDELADQPQVESIGYDAQLHLPQASAALTSSSGWNLQAVHAPDLWLQGVTGAGVVIATLDSGVDPFHPDLAPAWRGGGNSWYDPYGVNPTPHDVSGHGTNVMGLILGGDASGETIGMAPDAQWIAAKIFDNSGTATFSAIHLSFQWVLDPDGYPATDDAPHVVNNSWNILNSVGECDLEFGADIAALESAEIVVVFSAGNSGPGSWSSMSPANDPASVSSGAVDETLTIDSGSARGPSACGHVLFPRLVAPGVDVWTTDLTFGGLIPDSYKSVSGTSFAAPHVTGAVALLKSGVPSASRWALEAALQASAVDLGAPGPDSDYGAGLIDVSAAYDVLLVGAGPVPMLPPPGTLLLIGSLLAALGLLGRRVRSRAATQPSP